MTRVKLQVIGGDCLTVLRDMESESVHSIVTDPPYGLSQVDSAKLTTALTAWINGDRERVPGGKGFMGKEWDAFVPPPAVWDECLRVLKPGGHMLVFAGSRTVDLMGLSIRLAGFEIRDTLQWLYGSGFPKSMDVSKAVDATLLHGGSNSRRMKSANESRPGEVRTRTSTTNNGIMGSGRGEKVTNDNPATDAAREWEGWGTALKPAAEPIFLARKPLESTVARNVLAHGVGGLNIDGCRIDNGGVDTRRNARGGDNGLNGESTFKIRERRAEDQVQHSGRFPANVILSHNEGCDTEVCERGCPVAELDAQSGNLKSPGTYTRGADVGAGLYDGGVVKTSGDTAVNYGDSGGASRFFPSFRYQAKAPTRERPKVDGVSHPTVKPLALMRWLVRLVTPPGGTVLDPFAGSGTTLQAAQDEGFDSIGIERDEDYMKLINARLGTGEAA